MLSAMSRHTATDSRQEILDTAARLFRQRGYDATSMGVIAGEINLSKSTPYHYFKSKAEILFNLMNHALDITEERVVNPVRAIADPEERLRILIGLHIEVVLSGRDREITLLLHENHPLPASLRSQINTRKKAYVHFVEDLVSEVQRTLGSKPRVSPRAATFALLGMINWMYQWYKPQGQLSAAELTAQYTEIFFAGAFR